jgi:hypothetical protein
MTSGDLRHVSIVLLFPVGGSLVLTGFSQPIFSRAFNGLKISRQLLPELKIDMLKTSMGS